MVQKVLDNFNMFIHKLHLIFISVFKLLIFFDNLDQINSSNFTYFTMIFIIIIMLHVIHFPLLFLLLILHLTYIIILINLDHLKIYSLTIMLINKNLVIKINSYSKTCFIAMVIFIYFNLV